MRVLVFFCLAVGLAATASGCGSTCGSNCPAVVFDVVATPGETLNVATAQLTGVACPLALPQCRGDYNGANACVRLSLVATQPGSCELDITFSDGRADVHAQTSFDVETHQGCCHGMPVIGPTSYMVPPLHGSDASADGIDAGPDATDAGAPDAPNDDAGDAGEARD